MAFIEGYWWLWLVLTVIGYGYVLYNQLRRMKGMLSPAGPAADPFSAFFSGLMPMVVVGFISSGTAILLVISVVVKVIRYSTNS